MHAIAWFDYPVRIFGRSHSGRFDGTMHFCKFCLEQYGPTCDNKLLSVIDRKDACKSEYIGLDDVTKEYSRCNARTTAWQELCWTSF